MLIAALREYCVGAFLATPETGGPTIAGGVTAAATKAAAASGTTIPAPNPVLSLAVSARAAAVTSSVGGSSDGGSALGIDNDCGDGASWLIADATPLDVLLALAADDVANAISGCTLPTFVAALARDLRRAAQVGGAPSSKWPPTVAGSSGGGSGSRSGGSPVDTTVAPHGAIVPPCHRITLLWCGPWPTASQADDLATALAGASASVAASGATTDRRCVAIDVVRLIMPSSLPSACGWALECERGDARLTEADVATGDRVNPACVALQHQLERLIGDTARHVVSVAMQTLHPFAACELAKRWVAHGATGH